MATDPKIILTPGLIIIATIKNKPYQGVIVRLEGNEGVFVRLLRPDQGIMTIMLDSKIPVQCITDEGLAYRFECKLLSKKIPNIGIKYPEEPSEGVNVRKNPRIAVSYWTVIQEQESGSGKPQFKDVGEGNIANMSMGGCKLMTSHKLIANDIIYLSFEYTEGKPFVRFKGKVRQVRPAPHELTYYGIMFEDPTQEFLKIVETILKNPSL